MKSLAALSLALASVDAFPAVLEGMVLNKRVTGQSGCTTSKLCDTAVSISNSQIGYNPKSPTAAQKVSAARQNCGAVNVCATFDASEQFVSQSGQYAYASPTSGQIRGPCPGLNAAANHGYLPRSGVPSITQTIAGLGAMYAMSTDLAGFLAAYAVAIDGDIVTQTWSIGGPQGALLANPQGISWSHNKYEGDTSIGRCDAYINGGDAHSLSTTRFASAYASNLNGQYTMDTFSQDFAKKTFWSIKQNPYYFTGLFSTTLVSPAAYNFVIAFMSNHSANSIGGYLTEDSFKTWFAVTGDYPNFTWLPGQERMPPNWYRRPRATPYTASGGVFGDLLVEFAAYPDSFRFGGNLGKTNTYTGIDISNVTGGVYNSGDILQGHNFQCFVYEALQQGVPDLVTTGPLSGTILKFLQPYLTKALGGVSCKKISKFNDNDLGKYPGHTYSPTPPAGDRENC